MLCQAVLIGEAARATLGVEEARRNTRSAREIQKRIATRYLERSATAAVVNNLQRGATRQLSDARDDECGIQACRRGVRERKIFVRSRFQSSRCVIERFCQLNLQVPPKAVSAIELESLVDCIQSR